MKNRPSFITFALVAVCLFDIGAASAQSGNAVVDNIISPYAHRAGNSTSASHLDLSLYPPYETLHCNSALGAPHENNCPSDISYTPNSDTGGGQAFGVGMTNYPAGEVVYVVPYVVREWYWDTNCDCYVEYWAVYYDYYVVTVPEQTLGSAAAAIEWGEDPHMPIHHSYPLSTMAFNFSGSGWCNPGYTGEEAPCGGFNPQSNVTYVDGAGYEDKISIEEVCALSQRDGTMNDANAGCFVSLEGWTTLPGGVYMDTTALDGGESFVPGVGTTQPMLIDESTEYYWYINFGALGSETIVGQEVRHHGAITVRVGISPFCIAEEDTWGHAACYFNVDQSPVSTPENLN